MDLAKIIGELRLELQCLDTAIASMEELARVQNLADSAARAFLPSDSEALAGSSEVPEEEPAKRRRGRPRKEAVSTAADATQSIAPGAAPSGGDSTASAA